METKKFRYNDSYGNEHSIDVSKDDFVMVQTDKMIADQAMQSKPTTFFKDAMRRFVKNKSSVVGAAILGVLTLSAIILPLAIQSDIDSVHPYETYLEPKLFDAGTGWWDGCRNISNVAIDVDWDKYDKTGEISGLPAGYEEDVIVNGENGITYNEITYINTTNTYAHGGYLRLNTTLNDASAELYSYYGSEVSYKFDEDLDSDTSNNHDYKISITTADATAFNDFTFGEQCSYGFYFEWLGNDGTTCSVPLQENISTYGTFSIAMSDHLDEMVTLANEHGSPSGSINLTSSNRPHLTIRLNNVEGTADTTKNLLIEKIVFSSDNSSDAELMENLSLTDVNKTLSLSASNGDKWYWSRTNGFMNIFRAKYVSGSFRYDTYAAAYGVKYQSDIGIDKLREWYENGYINADFSIVDVDMSKLSGSKLNEIAKSFVATVSLTDLGKTRCALVIDEEHPLTGIGVYGGGFKDVTVNGYVTYWRWLYPNATSMPRYLLGTDSSGRDLLKYTFAGLRTSLILGVCTFLFCFSFGLVWGAIAGYFGGWTDILMERFTDILGGVPWIVVMTLAIVKFGSNFLTFAIALCLTGWIGTSSLTRTQFYRYKNREYVLAARTLGASDGRLIFRHILPNAVGTIITSSVLMIPSVIFSEATLAYLQLGLSGMHSFGVILSDNQAFIETFPYLIYFPSAVMALLMISFNLFGNGLRDAFNPSLKGEGN